MNKKSKTTKRGEGADLKAGAQVKVGKYPPAVEDPLFGEEFLRLLSDYGYDTLRSYLQKAQVKPEAMQLLDSLMIMTWAVPKTDKVTWIDNQIMTEAVGAMSKEIVVLGGAYQSPLGQIVVSGGG